MTPREGGWYAGGQRERGRLEFRWEATAPMPGSHWMIITTPENFDISRKRGFSTVGLKARHRKKAERMSAGDRVLFYISHLRVFPATATVSSGFFEDHRAVWHNNERKPEVFPWRVPITPEVVLSEYEFLDARQIAPRLLYVKRWAPEDWPLAFQGQIHLLSSADFSLIEGEMRRVVERRANRPERAPRRPRERLAVASDRANGAAIQSTRV